MLKDEQPQLFVIVTAALAGYGKVPTTSELEAWWLACRTFTLDDVDRTLRAHEDDPDEGKRAPRPVDVKRRLRAGVSEGRGGCAFGGCQYPGIFCDGNDGKGLWWCPWHRDARGGPEAQRWADVSQRVPAAEAMAKRRERMHQESIAAPGVVDLARQMALRCGNRPWPSDKNYRLALPRAPENLDAEPV